MKKAFLWFAAYLIASTSSLFAMDEYSIRSAIKALGPSKSFSYFDLQLSDQEIAALNNIKISTGSYNNYGDLQALESEATAFLQSLSCDNNITAKTVSKCIVKLVNNVIQASDKETAWVSLRAFTPTSEYDIPRWHTDGYYYIPHTGDPYKVALTLKGPATLFYHLPAGDIKEQFRALQRSGSEQNNYNRQAIADLLGTDKRAMSIPSSQQGAMFIVGSDNAAVHSEPAIKEERLFLSILPGSKAQIEEWKNQ